jgi:hypothetical protein
MPEDYRAKTAQRVKTFYDKEDKIRFDKEQEAKKRKEFFDQFETKVNGAITEHVSDLLSTLGDRNVITIDPKGDPERTWYQVTISAMWENGEKRTCIVRFEADYDTKAISTQRPEGNGGRFTNINGAVTLGNFQTSQVSRALDNCLESVLRD